MIAYDALGARFSDAGLRFLAASDFDGRRSIMACASASMRDLFKVSVYNFYEVLRLLGEQHGTLLSGRKHCFPNSELFHAVTVAPSHLGSIFCLHPRNSSDRLRAWSIDYRMMDVPWRRVNIARFQIDRVRSNGYTAAGGALSVAFPDVAAARRIRLAQELTEFAPIKRDMAVSHGEFRDTLTIDPFTVTVYWITPVIPDSPAVPSWIETTVEAGHVILRWRPNLEPFLYSYEVYLLQNGEPAELLSPIPLRSAMWVDTAPPKGVRSYGVRAVSASGVFSTIVSRGAVIVD